MLYYLTISSQGSKTRSDWRSLPLMPLRKVFARQTTLHDLPFVTMGWSLWVWREWRSWLVEPCEEEAGTITCEDANLRLWPTLCTCWLAVEGAIWVCVRPCITVLGDLVYLLLFSCTSTLNINLPQLRAESERLSFWASNQPAKLTQPSFVFLKWICQTVLIRWTGRWMFQLQIAKVHHKSKRRFRTQRSLGEYSSLVHNGVSSSRPVVKKLAERGKRQIYDARSWEKSGCRVGTPHLWCHPNVTRNLGRSAYPDKCTWADDSVNDGYPEIHSSRHRVQCFGHTPCVASDVDGSRRGKKGIVRVQRKYVRKRINYIPWHHIISIDWMWSLALNAFE